MAISFIPEVWSAKMLVSLKKALVYAGPGVVNRDYEGEIKGQGDTVRIPSMGRPTIGTYTTNSTTISEYDGWPRNNDSRWISAISITMKAKPMAAK